MSDTFLAGWISAFSGGKYLLFVLSLIFLSLAGCSGQPQPVPYSPRAEAVSHNQRGIKAEAKGMSRLALEEFSEALRINSSIENSEGVLVALVNSSRVHRHNGDVKAALSLINRAVPLVTLQSGLFHEVAFEMAQVKLLSGDIDEASEWAAKAAGADNSSEPGMRKNLQARILFLKGSLAEAEIKVLEAMRLNDEKEPGDEKANSLRTLGDIQAAGNRRAEAAESYSQALAIDKSLGRSRKIAADLRALALLSLSLNESEQALGYYKRAFAVSSSGRDWTGASDDLLSMSRIHEKRGEKEQSERLLTERNKMLKKSGTE